MCGSFSITCALNTDLNTAWIKLTAFVFRCLFMTLYSHWKKWAYPKKERILLNSKIDRLVGFFFFNKKVVSCCINVYTCSERLTIVISSEKGYRLLSYVCPQRKYYTPYGKIFFQILWGINVKATHNCSSGPVWKERKEKKRKYNGLTGRQKSLSRPDFPFRSSLKHRNTDPRNRNL